MRLSPWASFPAIHHRFTEHAIDIGQQENSEAMFVAEISMAETIVSADAEDSSIERLKLIQEI